MDNATIMTNCERLIVDCRGRRGATRKSKFGNAYPQIRHRGAVQILDPKLESGCFIEGLIAWLLPITHCKCQTSRHGTQLYTCCIGSPKSLTLHAHISQSAPHATRHCQSQAKPRSQMLHCRVDISASRHHASQMSSLLEQNSAVCVLHSIPQIPDPTHLASGSQHAMQRVIANLKPKQILRCFIEV